MFDKIFVFRVAAFIFILHAALACYAQQTEPPVPRPPTVDLEGQDPIKIYAQEVRLPVVAYDERERFDPTLSPEDILVLEDGVPQQIRSVSRVPANILLVLDMGGQVTAAVKSNTTREAALSLITIPRPDDRLAIIQNSNRVELLQDWTADIKTATQMLKTKFFSSSRSRLSECLTLAAKKLEEQPVGNVHVIIFTDGLEAQTRGEIHSEPIHHEAIRSLIATQASVHIFGFAALVKDFVRERNSPISVGGSGNTIKIIIDTDMEMRRWFKNYARITKQREEQLAALAEETGGRLLLPTSTEEFIKLADKVSRDIRAQYVVTYTPKRPFANVSGTERRRTDVLPRRIGLHLFSLRNYITTPAM